MVTLRIISEGSGQNTRVLAVDEDGFEHEVRHVSKVEWDVDARGPARAVLHAIAVDFDVELPADCVDVRDLRPRPRHVVRDVPYDATGQQVQAAADDAQREADGAPIRLVFHGYPPPRYDGTLTAA